MPQEIFHFRPSEANRRKNTVSGHILYSTNPWYAHEIAVIYRQDRHFVWCSEYYDPATAPSASAAAAIAPSSSPRNIYDALFRDFNSEDGHSSLIKGYKRKFRFLARDWLAKGEISQAECDEIVATVNSHSFKIWRPVLYIIPRHLVAGRLKQVQSRSRAAYGPEFQVEGLLTHEFDRIER